MSSRVPALRPYQMRDLERIEAAFNEGAGRVCYQAPTGSGKMVLLSDLKKEATAAKTEGSLPKSEATS